MNEEIKSILEDNESVIFTNPAYEKALIGVTHDSKAVYDFNKMVECLCEEDGMNPTDAEDFIGYNTIRAIPYMGEKAPVIIYRMGN